MGRLKLRHCKDCQHYSYQCGLHHCNYQKKLLGRIIYQKQSRVSPEWCPLGRQITIPKYKMKINVLSCTNMLKG